MSRNTIANLKRQRKRPAVFLREMLLQIGREEKTIFSLVEGYDAPYYSIRIHEKRPNKLKNYVIHFINCEGKANVIELVDLLSRNDQAKNAFYFSFVDSDFDSNSNISKKIYVTRGYSVENFYISDECFLKFLASDIFGGTHLYAENHAIYERCIESFLARKAEFAIQSRLFNAWYFIQKKKQNVSLNKVKKLPLSSVTFDNAVCSYSLSTLNGLIDEISCINEEDLAERLNYFCIQCPTLFGRGKQVAIFLRDYINSLILKANTGLQPFNRKFRIIYNFTNFLILNIFIFLCQIMRDLVPFCGLYRIQQIGRAHV